ncbi:MAG: MFS transporter [Kutzneria sp.]|nr:MFS transporter [Kutzneria sp.]MBV9847546.1 MFS transporter [Kutzneria sp.]
MLSPLFRDFFLGQLVSQLGSSMAPVALAFAVLNASGRPGDLGIALACQIAPHLALLLLGGAVADRFPRRVVLVVANLGAGLTQGAVATVLLTGHYDLVLVSSLELANGALEAFTSPALRGIVAELVAPADLQRANSLLASARNATRILGPTTAGLLVVGVGGGWAIGLDAASFVAAALVLARLRLAATVKPRSGRLLTDVRDGWRAFRATPWIGITALSFCVVNLVNTGPWQILGPALTREHGGETAWGVVVSVRAAGLLAMSALMYRLVPRHPLRIGQLTCAMGALSLLALGLGLSAPWLMACAFLTGLGFTASGITWDTALQRHVPRTALSRVSSCNDLLCYAAIPVGQLLVGPAAARWGGATVAFWCGVTYLLAALAPLLARSVRDLGSSCRSESGVSAV